MWNTDSLLRLPISSFLHVALPFPFFFYFFFTSSNNALSLSFLHSCYRIFVFKIYRNYLKYWDEARGKLVKIYIGLSSLYIYDRPCESLCTLSWKEDRNEIMLDKIFINFSTSKTSRLFFDFLSSLTRGAKKIQKIFDCIIRGSVFYQKNEGNVYFTFSGFNSHREIRTIYLTTTYPRFQRWDGGGGSIWIAFDQTSWPGNRLRHVSWNTFSRLHWSQVESVPSRKTKNAIYPSKTRDSCSRLGTKYFNAIASNHTWQISRDKTPWIFNNNSKKEKKNSKLPIPSFKKKNIFFFPPPSLFSTEIFHAGTKSGRFDK